MSSSQDDILMVALARAVSQNVKEVPVYRVSGVKPGSSKAKWGGETELESK